MTTPETLFQAALARHQAGALDEAEAAYARVLAAQPAHAGALGLMGALRLQQNRFGDALAWLEKSLAAAPHQPPALNNKGLALSKLGRHDEAVAAFNAALALRPDYAEAVNNRGNAQRDRGEAAAALADYARAMALKPGYAEAVNNRGSVLHQLGRVAEALADYERALALSANFVLAHVNRGVALTDLGRVDEAGACFARALTIKPDDADAAWAKGMWHLLRGEMAEGWRLYERRWDRAAADPGSNALRRKLWLGETPLAGRSILLFAEQGFGDTIQFVRYAALVADQAARVVLMVQPELKSLLAGFDARCEVVAAGEPLPTLDFHCPLMSLPLAFKTTLATIPHRTPYLSAAPGAVEEWRARLGVKTKMRVGLAWAGRPTHRNNAQRSIDGVALAPLLAVDAEFHAVQSLTGEPDHGGRARIRQHALRDFADTAALMTHMDLIISVDSAPAHLAGALGKPTWILLPFAPDFRWMTAREDTPWYPTARLLRQNARGDWASVIARAAAELRRMG